jgi:polygalacturonase
VRRDQCSPNRFNPCLLIYKASNVSVTGGGRLEGNGAVWWKLHHEKKLPAGRPRLLETMWARDIVIEHVQLYNSPFWTTHLWASDNIEVGHVDIYAPSDSPNTDGVDPDSSSNVHIHHLKCHNGDDGIAVKSGMNAAGIKFGRPTTNVLVEDSSFTFSHGLSIGSEVSGGVSNITFRNIVVELVSAAGYIKTAPARGGYVRDISFEGIEVKGAQDVVRFNTGYSHSPPSPTETAIENISYRRISGFAERAGEILCTKAIPCNNLLFDEVDVTAVFGYSCGGPVTGKQTKCSPKVTCV